MAESEEGDAKKLADRFEKEADDLERRGQQVEEHIETTRQEWQRKRGDSSVPGAVPEDPEQDTDE